MKSLPTTTITRTIHQRTPVVILTTTLETVTVTPAVLTEIVTDYETTVITSTADAVTDTFSTTSTDLDGGQSGARKSLMESADMWLVHIVRYV